MLNELKEIPIITVLKLCLFHSENILVSKNVQPLSTTIDQKSELYHERFFLFSIMSSIKNSKI